MKEWKAKWISSEIHEVWGTGTGWREAWGKQGKREAKRAFSRMHRRIGKNEIQDRCNDLEYDDGYADRIDIFERLAFDSSCLNDRLVEPICENQ
jgi:hypothetical protein